MSFIMLSKNDETDYTPNGMNERDQASDQTGKKEDASVTYMEMMAQFWDSQLVTYLISILFVTFNIIKLISIENANEI